MSARSPVTSPAHRNGQSWSETAWQYLTLMRIDKPIGIWLLLWPTLWALWVAADGQPNGNLFAIFVVGVVVTRSAGCVINDLADRRIDREVSRTQFRPLATGQVSVAEATVLFIGLGFIAIGLALMLNPLAQVLAGAATVLLIVYPFTKRFLSVPQLVLGAAFGMAVPMAFAATTGELPAVAWLMFAITLVWAVIYDTMYAMVDRDEDIEAGVRSTAILFGDADRFVIAGLQASMVLGLLMLGSRTALGGWYYASLVAVLAFMLYQQWLIRDRDRDGAFAAFRNNHYVGLAVFVGIALDYQFAVA
ncbi:MAG: 4-hydroxybenzoate octaprenyltransferase [Pseudomonadota bacterium]